MKFSNIPALLTLTALALIASPSAMAQDSGWYLGANVGKTKAKIDDDRIITGVIPSGFTVTAINDDDSGTGFKLFGGYQFNRYFSLEGGYFDLGKVGYQATTLPAGTLNGEMKVNGLNLDLVLNLPFTEKFSAFARVGAAHANAKDTFVGTGAVLI